MADGALPSSTQSGTVKTTCPYCGVGCGIEGLKGTGRALAVSGDPLHPANRGRLCSKGTALGATVGLEGRLLHPTVAGHRVSWADATSHVAQTFRDTIARHGPDSVAFYVSGQLLTEDYYAANKLMKGFIGSSNIDTNSRLCMASAVAAHKIALGADLVPGCYEDLELADLVVFAGHNAAWTHPVLYRRMETARARGQKHVVIDPRRTDTAEGADLHLPIAPQSDVRLWNGLMAEMIRRGATDLVYVKRHVDGFDKVRAALEKDDQSLTAVAQDCDLRPEALHAFYDLVAENPRMVTLFSQGANQSAQGVNKGLSILNLHLATGRIGKPGACPFSITGQPNAMGGRETGGMANTLAAHMDFDDASLARLSRFWSAPNLARRPGLKAVEMFDAVRDGRIKAIWIMATNPVVSLPDSKRVIEALEACPFVVVSDCMDDTDTAAYADVKLPALAWGEKDGTVTNSERRISRQRSIFPAPGEARADWRIIADVANAMGHGDAFSWPSNAAVFGEWARLTTYENEDRPLNLAGLIGLGKAGYDQLQPVQWPVLKDKTGTARLFEDGCFATPDGRARMVAVETSGPASATDATFPLALNTGRIRDQWHTMTRTGLAPDLCRHAPEPYVDIHPQDAERAGVKDGALTRVVTARGEAIVVAHVTDRQRRGDLFMPMHWSQVYASSGRANPLVAAKVDDVSGQPEFKHSPARVAPYRETWKGFLLSRRAVAAPRNVELIWRRVTKDACQLYEFAGREAGKEQQVLRQSLARRRGAELLTFEDQTAGSLREAALWEGRLEWVLLLTRDGRLPSRDWLAELFEKEALSPLERASLLAGSSPGATPDRGPIVCACLKIGARTIEAAIAGGAVDVDTISAVTSAGGNCGSCRVEIGRMLAAHAPSIPKKEPAHVS